MEGEEENEEDGENVWRKMRMRRRRGNRIRVGEGRRGEKGGKPVMEREEEGNKMIKNQKI